MTTLSIISPYADIHGVQDINATRGKFETQLVYGEQFTVTANDGEWCEGFCVHDGYKGNILRKHLGNIAPPTHTIIAVRSHAYKDATMKSPLVQTLSFGSSITVTKEDEKFAQLADGSWIYKHHIAPTSATDTDYVAHAMKFIETPYYWGGRSGFGIDCSGLAQVALGHAGINIPRDCDQQENVVGTAVKKHKRGDLVYFKGHVGIMADGTNIIHANAHHMKVTCEPLNIVAGRSGGITSIRRI